MSVLPPKSFLETQRPKARASSTQNMGAWSQKISAITTSDFGPKGTRNEKKRANAVTQKQVGDHIQNVEQPAPSIRTHKINMLQKAEGDVSEALDEAQL